MSLRETAVDAVCWLAAGCIVAAMVGGAVGAALAVVAGLVAAVWYCWPRW